MFVAVLVTFDPIIKAHESEKLTHGIKKKYQHIENLDNFVEIGHYTDHTTQKLQ